MTGGANRMSPFVTVGVLTVLWLIVVVPMIVRRNDEVARDRSIRQFGRAMRALGRRSDTRIGAPPDPEVFVAGRRQSERRPTVEVAVRRPVPADAALQREAAMYPVDRSEMSAARAAMMARRRRSLTVLGVGSLITTIFALVAGGLVWLVAGLFLAGLAGCLVVLRAQARRDRTRRPGRRPRSQHVSRDITAAPEEYTEFDEAVVRIDDDDVSLQTMDTIDLTGLYPVADEELAVERKAS